MKKKFFLSSIGGLLAQNIASCIRDQFPDAQIIGSDTHVEHAGSYFADRVLIVDRVESEILAIEIAKVRRISRSEMKSFIDRHYYECFEQVKFLKETAWECLKTKKIDESWIDKLRTKLNYFYQW